MGIVRGKSDQYIPRKVLIYGEEGLGKSTFAASFPKPIFLTTEEGVNNIDVDHFPVVRTLTEFKNNLNDLYKVINEYRTIVIDSLDALEKLIWKDIVSRSDKITNIEDFGYGKGYIMASSLFTALRDKLDTTFRTRENGLNLVFISHATVKNFDDPDNKPYHRYQPALQDHLCRAICDWVDEIFFVRSIVTSDKSETKQEKRMLFTTKQPAHTAKSRLELNNEYLFTRECFSKNFSQFYK